MTTLIDPSIDFIVCAFHNCAHTTNDDHDSDGGIRLIWGPLFDKYEVDLVVNGHNHAYERNYPIRGEKVTKKVKSGGTVDPKTYIVAGGGGVGLSTGWNAHSASGTTAIKDPVQDASAYREAVWSCIEVVVTPPD